MESSWSVLDSFRGDFFQGEWPSIPEHFQISLHQYPDCPCFTAFTPELIKFTYKEAYEVIQNTVRYLMQAGMKKGDRVVLTGKNSPYWALAYLSVMEAGGVIVPLDYQMEPERMNYLINFVEAEILFIDKEKCDLVGFENDTKIKTRISLSKEKSNFIMDLPASPEKEYSRPAENDLAAILFTSGTTGNEKGVMLTHRNFISDAYYACDPNFLIGEHKDVWYALLPLHHSYCMTAVFMESIIHGSDMVFAAGLATGQIMNDLKMGKITIVMGIPLLYNKILKGLMKQVRTKGLIIHTYIGLMMRLSGLIKIIFKVNLGKKLFKALLVKANLYNVKYLICGGGPLAPETFKRYNQLGLDFVQGYGLTETAPIIALNPSKHFKVESVGKIFPLCEAKIIDKDEDGIGEVIIKGSTTCSGYYKNKEATDELFTEDGYLKTGDLGYLDKDNYLYLTGRKKSMIVTEGGKNIFPEEIEDHFQLFQQIEQILIKGYLADKETKAEGIEAVIYPSEEHYQTAGIFNEEEIKADIIKIIHHVNRELLPYKRISKLRLTKEPMEMTTTKKLKRPNILEKLKKSEDTGFLI